MSTNEFLQPWTPGPTKDYSDNINLHIGTRVRFAWADRLTSQTELRLVQDNHPGDAQGGPDVTISDSVTGTMYEWTVSYLGLDPAFNNVFYISIMGNAHGANTHYFNISNSAPETLPSSASSSSSTLPSSTSGFTAAANPTNPNSTSSPTQTVVMTSGLGPGPVAGIAVGAVVGVFLLIGALWLGWRAYQKNKKKKQAALLEQQQKVESGQSSNIPKHAELQGASSSSTPQQHAQWYGNSYPPMTAASGAGTTVAGAYQGGYYYYTGQDGKQYYYEAQGNEVYEAGDTQVRRYQLS